MRRLATTLLAVLLGSLVLTGCSAADDEAWADELPSTVTIATGGTTGIYYAYGRALADVLTQRYGVDAEVLETSGSVDNLHLLDDGTAQIGFSAADAAGDAVAGTGDFDHPVDVRAVARVYDDFEHLVVPASSPVTTIEDLRGLRVSVGAQGSGTSLIARRVLAAADVAEADLRVSELGITESIDALRRGRVDAFFWSGGLRTPGLVELSEEMDVRLVPLQEVVDEMRDEFGHGYRHGVVREGVYGGPADVETLAVPNMLLVGADLPDDVAYGLTALLFDARAELVETVDSAALLDRARAIYTAPTELHPGALRYYRDTKS
ncbi:TAXI family TRAP transporter solute-binding subunit [Isoptericola aurantiacus]|uniref:TAXI family TRAP transporter solute-binding subunit n=1 Tax=Isoptericola aurantiacus TaxID=3377839 RepID=UPI00383B7204